MVECPALELAGWAAFGAPVSVGAFQGPPCRAGDAGMITTIMGVSSRDAVAWMQVLRKVRLSSDW